jgi:hypothetical protein
MATIGFSTGALAFGDFKKALGMLSGTRANAVELSALRMSELSDLIAYIQSDLSELKRRYRYVGFHAPTNFEDEKQVIQQLLPVARMGLGIVVHPDTMRDLSAWRALEAQLLIENMDSRRRTGRTAEELYPFFEALPQARLCFDIGHARQVDPTMIEAGRILSLFSNRLSQAHLSEVNSQGKHFSMSHGAARAYEPFAKALATAPIILESIVSANEIEGEIDTTQKIINFKNRTEERIEYRISRPFNYAMA